MSPALGGGFFTTEPLGKHSNKYVSINNYFKYKWTKFSSQKAEWLNGYKGETHVHTTYKRVASDLKTLRWKVKVYNKHFKKMKMKRKPVAIFVSYKIDYETKTATRDT